jgi:TetR/AcrR family tetracycline transcriptional repressor
MSEQMVRMAREKMPPFPPDLPWDEKIAEGMRRQYEAIIGYRDGARVVAGNRPTEASLPQIENFLKVWVEAGFPPSEALAYILAFGDFITGCALEYQAEIERRAKPGDQSAELWKKMEAYPTLHAASLARGAGNEAVIKAGRRPSSFERGLRLLMAGLRLRHAELMAEKQKAALERRPSED